jgi:hypothetical protein
VKAINHHFRCDLCGRFRKLGVTESYNCDDQETALETTVCATCIRNATRLLLDALILVSGDPPPDAPEADATG